MDEPKAEKTAGEASPEQIRGLERKLHQTILKVTDDIESFRFNTAIAAMMELNNYLIKAKETPVAATPLWTEAITSLTLMLAPIFPHISEELWHRLGHDSFVHLQSWPVGDGEKAKEDEITIAIQINGKVREQIRVTPDTPKDELERLALASEGVQKWIDGKTVRKVIVVPGRLVNVVIG
jgi:leucyl-tRNA synthetase